MSWYERYWGLLVGGALVLVLLGLFTGMALAEWPELGFGPDPCVVQTPDGPVDKCYCENLRPGLVKQPANTWSDLGFMLVGLVILAVAGNENGRSRSGGNPMTTGHWLAVLYGLVIIMMGPGSMMFHASYTAWGGFLDSVSMFFLLTFLIGYDLRQMTDWPEWVTWLLALLVLVLFMALRVAFPEQATVIFLIMALVAVGVELPIWFGWGVKVKRSTWWLLGFAGAFFTSLLIWGLSHTDGPLCDPDAWLWQGHAWWHIGAAGAMLVLFFYLRSESGGRKG